MATTDYYALLGVGRGASSKETQAAYRRLARKYHPDVTGGDKEAEERFKAVTEAYHVLSDDTKRAAYDKWGDQWMHAEQLEKLQREGGLGAPGGFRFEFGSDGRPFDAGELFEDLGGGGGVFDRLFGRRGAQGPRRGQDMHQRVTVSLAEAFQGTTRNVQLQSQEPCPACAGSGRIGSATCHACQGQGRQPAGKRLEVQIPAGVEDGTRIRLRGQGGPGSAGGPPGDVVLLIALAEDPRFERRGAALHSELAVPLTTAVLGGEVPVATLSGAVVLRIPEGTQNGRVFRLTGHGMPIMPGDQRGDLFVKVRVQLPEQLNEEARRLFGQLRELESDAPSAKEQRSA